MFEGPEVRTLTRQAEQELVGRRITLSSVSPTRPRFLSVSPDPLAFSEQLTGRTIQRITCTGKSLRTHLDTEAILVIGETGGRFQLHAHSDTLPKKIHWQMALDDGRCLTLTIQMWGFLALMTEEELASHPYLGSDGPDPMDPGFSVEMLEEAIRTRQLEKNDPIKAFLIHGPNIAGIGNGYLQDILFRARLSPKRKLADLTDRDVGRLHEAIVETLSGAVQAGGRDTELDLYGEPGSYVPLLDRRQAGAPCPACGEPIQKTQYLGGACYLCPVCQT